MKYDNELIQTKDGAFTLAELREQEAVERYKPHYQMPEWPEMIGFVFWTVLLIVALALMAWADKDMHGIEPVASPQHQS